MSLEKHVPRREVKARHAGWAENTAAWLAAKGIQPNTISMTSILFSGLAGICLLFSARSRFPYTSVLLVLSAFFIQFRLLCNLFDGMVAIEGGKRTPSGSLFNDFPDRISDSIILVCAGYACRPMPFAAEVGWLAAILALFTAYLRVLAGASGAEQRFLGPMAKQHRLAILTLAVLAAALAARWGKNSYVVLAALAIIVAGSAVTALRRLLQAVRELEDHEK